MGTAHLVVLFHLPYKKKKFRCLSATAYTISVLYFAMKASVSYLSVNARCHALEESTDYS